MQHRQPIQLAQNEIIIGCKEWVSLPDLQILAVQAKVDTGAKTSALHAEQIETWQEHDQDWVRFVFNSNKYNEASVIACCAPILARRRITSSNGMTEERVVISTDLILGTVQKTIEITLTDRSQMAFPMLLGRQALLDHFLVDCNLSYTVGEPS